MRILLLFSFLSLFTSLDAQFTISGTITDQGNAGPIEFVTVFINDQTKVTETDAQGRYVLQLNNTTPFDLKFNRLGYTEYSVRITQFTDQEINLEMKQLDSDIEVIIQEKGVKDKGVIREDVGNIKLIPSTTGNFESVLPSIALGASNMGGELSSQYSVRGGNYDENLVYVNDFEIFRPQLIRNSQQEGLSFPNLDLIDNISFSSGGFDAKYGDKLSSILDIQYKRPEEFHGSVSASLLGATAHVEGAKQLGNSSYRKLRYLVGARYKTNQYLLNSLDVEGQYAPKFTDFQTYLTYDLSNDLQLGILGNYNRSIYDFVPTQRSTAVGTFSQILNLTTVFEGSEHDDFENGMGGVSLTYIPSKTENPIFFKFLASNYFANEREGVDIIGRYNLSQIESDINSDGENDQASILGVGTQHEFIRTQLFSQITNFKIKGGVELSNRENTHFIQWGAGYQYEEFNDNINEWERQDSAGYSLPYSETEVNLFEVIKAENDVHNHRFDGYIQDEFTKLVPNRYDMTFNAGVRATYRRLNGEFNISPRLQFLYRPLRGDGDITYKLATGYYYQPPLYREMRRSDGTLNTDVKAQKSLQILGGITYDFLMPKVSDQKFRIVSEVYYKKLSNIIHYDLDNIQIRYSGENDASGDVYGLDFRLNGEFVPNSESWINLSLLSAKESLNGVDHIRINQNLDTTFVSKVPRPTDQFLILNVFFQDYLPSNDDFSVHLNLNYGSGLPFGSPYDNVENRNPLRYKAYRRVDIGFSYLFWDAIKNTNTKQNSIFRGLDRVSMSLEVFNLFGIENQASSTFVRTILQQQYIIPNNLTSRRFNLKFKVDF